MASFKKYKSSAVYALIDHDERNKTEHKDNIDKSRSNLNYNFISDNAYEKAKNRIRYAKENGAILRDNSVVVVQYLMTLPKNFPDNEELEREFFKANFNYIKEIFGEENIISAIVHKDESQNHIHINILPIVEKTKTYKNGTTKKRLAFDAKNLINKDFLKKFHKKMEKELEDWLGFKPEILNGATKYGNKTIEELEAITEAKKELNNILKNTPTNLKTHYEYTMLKKEQKQIINELWEEYKEISNSYWNNYKMTKERIKNELWELKKGISGTEKQLENDLNFIYNLTHKGLLFALFSLIGALFTFTRNKSLKEEQKQIEAKLEELDKARRSISNYQHNTKEKLKEKDLDKIENALNSWENAILKANETIKENILNRAENENKGHLRAFRDSYENIDK